MAVKVKKHSFVRILCLAIFAVFAVSAFVGCNGDSTDESSSTVLSDSESSIAESSAAESSAEVFQNSSNDESIAESSTAAEESSESEDISAPDESIPEESSVIDESIEPEILGTGTKSDPYLMTPDENQTVITYSIPSGESQYYAIYRVGSTILTIEDENALVEYDGIPYPARKGKVTVEIAYALASDAILFEISNEGDSDAVFTLKFANPLGTMANPEKISDITKKTEVSIPAGNETGYHFVYIAENDGAIRFYMDASVPSIFSVTNNTTSANRTSGETEEEYVEIEVVKGDELIIVVGANRKGREIPAVDVAINGVYA
ncbi:MAG: hypothetical protein J6R49_01530 [Clostridia bacterium]|nr:hypothetical protein [Clostridia bacterium]